MARCNGPAGVEMQNPRQRSRHLTGVMRSRECDIRSREDRNRSARSVHFLLLLFGEVRSASNWAPLCWFCSGEVRPASYWVPLCWFCSGEVRCASNWAPLCWFCSGEVRSASYRAPLCWFCSGEARPGLPAQGDLSSGTARRRCGRATRSRRSRSGQSAGVLDGCSVVT